MDCKTVSPAWGSFVIVLALLGLFSGCGKQETGFPDRPIILICPWAAGGGTDRVARQVAVGLEGKLGVPVNVVNATGASGVTGHTRGALARADGYTITLATAELNMLHWRGLTPIRHEDFRLAALVNRDPAALFVRKEAPWQTLEELNEHVRQNPRALQGSGTALGGIWHVAMAAWLNAIAVDVDAIRWISIEGSTPSLQELMAGGLDLVSCSLPEARSLLEAGEIRSLGVMADQRLDQFPNVPTMKEQGVDVSVGTWRGVTMPPDVPTERARILEEALESVVKSEEFRTFMRRAGFNWAFEGPEEFRESLVQLDADFGEVLTSDAFVNMGDEIIGPMVFPAFFGILGGIVLGGLLLTKGIGRSESAQAISRRGMVRVGEILLGVGVYVLAAELVGFVLTAFAIVSVLMWRLGVRWWVSLWITLLVVMAVYHIFAVMLRVPLPRGILGW